LSLKGGKGFEKSPLLSLSKESKASKCRGVPGRKLVSCFFRPVDSEGEEVRVIVRVIILVLALGESLYERFAFLPASALILACVRIVISMALDAITGTNEFLLVVLVGREVALRGGAMAYIAFLDGGDVGIGADTCD
jgi:hypothetical protein